MSIEKIQIHTNSKLFLLPILKNYSAITLGKYIFIKNNTYSDKLLHHEMCHILQQEKVGFFYFYMFYIYCFIKLYLISKNLKEAYHSIPFEVEAYELQELSIEEIEEKINERYKVK